MPGTVKTTLNYYPSSGFKEMLLGTLEMFRRPFDPREVEVTDIRGREADFHLDTHGFALHPHNGRHASKCLLNLIQNASFEEMQQKATTALPGSKLAGNVAPARAVHIDQSTSGAHDILRDNLGPNEAEQFQKTRWAIINAWRPLEPVRRDPLGLCDARTVREEDLVDVQTYLPSSAQDKYKSLSKERRLAASGSSIPTAIGGITRPG
ncbi:uncharacterized protein CDV56_104823 [Aspergillus thermomutatus]|uniref:Uncharacterized protein n=1 Tax=Aspergillus thermomutatus TaxID=41047 RepID=A0A397GCJ9_ASPTH|nr:uncharacterized protein CDV56_104823 [Aspergillus thermomutatus]RHZ46683.1 hypothetical protein CDV56_104823 [Aspergillus thermomutatus]